MTNSSGTPNGDKARIERLPSALEALFSGFEADLFSTDPEILATAALDRTKDYYGLPLALARPRSTQELSQLMVACRELGIGVVPPLPIYHN